jgi:predicted acyl esterase
VRLHDVDPAERASFMLEGAALARGGEPVRVRLGDTAYRVRRGHRLRLAVSTSSFPQYLVHPGTDEDPWHATTRRPARQRLRTGGPDGAALHLPIRRLETET